MRCKHNRIECIKDELFCIHCGTLIKKGTYLTGDNPCKIKHMDKDNVKTITEVGVLEENKTEKNISHVCRRHVLDLYKEGENLKEPICKMSVLIEEYNSEDNYCALATLVKCEGLREDSRNCPFWKREGE